MKKNIINFLYDVSQSDVYFQELVSFVIYHITLPIRKSTGIKLMGNSQELFSFVIYHTPLAVRRTLALH